MDNLHKKMPSNLFKINQTPRFLLILEEKIEWQVYQLNMDKDHLLVIRILLKILDLIYILLEWVLHFLMSSNHLLIVLFQII